MVAPSEEWEDTEDGYRNGDTVVFVRPVSVQWSDGDGRLKSGEGYGVSAEYGYDGHRSVATFGDARTAWEFANLLTHYLDRRGPAQSALSELTRENGPGMDADLWEPPALIEDMEAVEVLEKMAGWYSFVVEEIRADTGRRGGSP